MDKNSLAESHTPVFHNSFYSAGRSESGVCPGQLRERAAPTMGCLTVNAGRLHSPCAMVLLLPGEQAGWHNGQKCSRAPTDTDFPPKEAGLSALCGAACVNGSRTKRSHCHAVQALPAFPANSHRPHQHPKGGLTPFQAAAECSPACARVCVSAG